MRTYREVLAVGEFRAMLGVGLLSVAAGTMQNLALASIVFSRTGSPLLTSLSFLAGAAPAVLGALTLMSLADRVRPRPYFVILLLVESVVALLLALAQLPLVAMVALVVAVGLLSSVGGGIQGPLVREVVGEDGFVLARSVLNIGVGAMQVLGFGVAGALLATVGAGAALLGTAALTAVGALVARLGLHDRAARATGRASLRLTAQGNRELLADHGRRALMLANWVPNGLIVGAEALYVPYAGSRAGVLYCSAAGGMLLGDVVMGRFVPPRRRFRLVVPFRLLLAVPYLLFFFQPGVVIGALAVFVASVGFAATLALQERLLEVTRPDLHAQAFGLQGCGMVSGQAAGALLVGSLAELTGVSAAMGLAAAASVLITAGLVAGLRQAGRPDAVASAAQPAAP